MPPTFPGNGNPAEMGGADPLVRAGPPGPALFPTNQMPASLDKPARGPAADQGVHPTHPSGRPELGKVYGIGLRACATEEQTC
jgi:hypothetical protein